MEKEQKKKKKKSIIRNVFESHALLSTEWSMHAMALQWGSKMTKTPSFSGYLAREVILGPEGQNTNKSFATHVLPPHKIHLTFCRDHSIERRDEERDREALYYNFNMDQRQIQRMSCRCDCEEFENRGERRLLQYLYLQARKKREKRAKKKKRA